MNSLAHPLGAVFLNGSRLETQSPEIQSLIAGWISPYSKATQKRYLECIEHFLNFTGGEPYFRNTIHVAEYIQSIAKYSNATINLHLAAVRSWAYTLEGTGYPVFRFKHSLPERTHGKRVLTHEEIRHLFTVGKYPEPKILYYTGMRASELASLDRESFTASGGVPVIVIKGKGGKVRVVKEHSELSESLKIIKAGEKPPTRTAIWKHVKADGHSAGFDDLCPHGIRATACTHMLQAGHDPMIVAKFMGHASTVTTMLYDYRRLDNMPEL